MGKILHATTKTGHSQIKQKLRFLKWPLRQTANKEASIQGYLWKFSKKRWKSVTFKLLFGRLYLATNSSSVFKSLSFHFLPVSSFDLRTRILELNECNVQMCEPPQQIKFLASCLIIAGNQKITAATVITSTTTPGDWQLVCALFCLVSDISTLIWICFLLAPGVDVCVCSYVCVPVFIMCLCINWKFPKSFKEAVIKIRSLRNYTGKHD